MQLSNLRRTTFLCLLAATSLSPLVSNADDLYSSTQPTSHQESVSVQSAERNPAMESLGDRTVIGESLEQKDKAPLHWEGAYIGEATRNFSGGAQVGGSYLGLGVLRGHLDLDRSVNWKGATFFLHLQTTHGEDPSVKIGDTQVASNIEAPANTGKVYEMWLQQTFFDEKISLLGGLYDLNSEFYVSEPAGLFLNASFGIGKEFSQTGNNGPSIFPTPGLAVRVKVQATDEVYIQAAAFEGTSGDPGAIHGTQVNYRSAEEGELLAIESGLEVGADEASKSKIAIGAWMYTMKVDHQTDLDGAGNPAKTGSSGWYVIANHELMKNFSGFVRYGMASHEAHRFASNASAGLVFAGQAYGRENDEIGFGFTTAFNGETYKSLMSTAGTPVDSAETSLELTYKIAINENIAIQPDLQYIINPNTDPSLENAVAGLLRVRIGFGN